MGSLQINILWFKKVNLKPVNSSDVKERRNTKLLHVLDPNKLGDESSKKAVELLEELAQAERERNPLNRLT